MLNNNDLDETIERVAAAVRDAEPTAREISAAKQRTWARLAAETAAAPAMTKANTMQLNNCDDFRALIPAFLNQELPEARALLFNDHARECIPCRKALTLARTGRVEANRASVQSSNFSLSGAAKQPQGWTLNRPALRWAMAAAMLVAIGGVSWFVYDRFIPQGTAHATV